MFTNSGKGGVWDSWVERWRDMRHISSWPVVAASLIHKEWNEGGAEGGGYYKLTLSYISPVNKSDHQTVKLSSQQGFAEGIEVGETIQLRINPSKPAQAVFADTAQSASNLMVAVIVGSVFLLVMLFRFLSH
jgi:hypothetical protein